MPVPLLEPENEATSVIDAYDFVGFTKLVREIQGRKMVKLQKVAEEIRKGGGGGGGEEMRGAGSTQ